MGSGKWCSMSVESSKATQPPIHSPFFPSTHPPIIHPPISPSTDVSSQLAIVLPLTTIHPSIHPSTSTSKNVKCQVMYKRQVILTGHKDPASNLWTLPIFPKEWAAKVDKYNSQNQIWASAKCGGTKYQKWKSSIAECESFGACSHSYVEHIVIPT